MSKGAVYELATANNPILVAVDKGGDDYTTECELELQPDGSILILDIRQYPAINIRERD